MREKINPDTFAFTAVILLMGCGPWGLACVAAGKWLEGLVSLGVTVVCGVYLERKSVTWRQVWATLVSSWREYL